MKKIKWISAAVMMVVSFTSCGIFKKDCNCPHFGNNLKNHTPQRNVS